MPFDLPTHKLSLIGELPSLTQILVSWPLESCGFIVTQPSSVIHFLCILLSLEVNHRSQR